MASVPPQGGRKHPHQELIQIDTTNILFICGGAFDGLEKIVESRLDRKSIGFNTELGKREDKDISELLQEVTPHDLVKFGLIPEFVGRVPICVSLRGLDREALIRILQEPKNALVKQYQKLFQMDHVKTDENRYKLDQGWKSMPDPVDPSKTLLYSDTDFQDKIYRTGFSHNHHIEVSGGTEKATFNMGLGYMTNEGTVITTSYKRYNFSLNGSLQARDNLKISARTTYSNSFTYGSPLAADATFYRSPAASPTTKFRFEDGSLAPGAAQYLGNAVYHMNIQVVLGKDYRGRGYSRDIMPSVMTYTPPRVAELGRL